MICFATFNFFVQLTRVKLERVSWKYRSMTATFPTPSRFAERYLSSSWTFFSTRIWLQVLGGGKCLVTFTPEQAITHEIEVMFNNDQVPGSPFLCRVLEDNDDLSYGGSSSGGFSHVIVELEHLALVPIAQPAEFTIRVPEGADAELAVSVQGPVEDIPVKVTGNVKNGLVAQFIPNTVGLHVVLVEYNGVAVGGTPFYSKAYDTDAVNVEGGGKGGVGKTVTFAGKKENVEAKQ